MASEHAPPVTCLLRCLAVLTPALVAGGLRGWEWPLLTEGQPSLLRFSFSFLLPNLSVSFPPLPASSRLSSFLHGPSSFLYRPLASLPTPFISPCPL